MALSSSSSESSLEVFDPPDEEPKPVTGNILLNPQPVCAYPGNKIFFAVKYNVKEPQTLYAIWRVGDFRVTRSNSLFTVIAKNGRFILTIRQVRLNMNGIVQVQIMQAIPGGSLGFDTQRTLLLVLRHNEYPYFYDWVDKFHTGHLSKLTIVEEDDTVEEAEEYSDVENDEYSSSTDPLSTPEYNDDGTGIHIAFMRFDDGTYYMEATDDDNKHVEATVRLKRNRAGNETLVIVCQDPAKKGVGGSTQEIVGSISGPKINELITARISKIDELSTELKVSYSFDETNQYNKTYMIGKPMKLFHLEYKAETIIAKGGYGSIRILQSKYSKKKMVAKLLDIRSDAYLKLAQKEISILKSVNHENIVTLLDLFSNGGTMILVEEYLCGGSLENLIEENGRLAESEVITFMIQVLSALTHLHEMHIVHLALTPCNILLKSKNSHVLKITNFRKARHVPPCSDVRPSPNVLLQYVAPEIVKSEKVYVSADMWSAGVLTYYLLSGILPFNVQDEYIDSAQITRVFHKLIENKIEDISDEALDFVGKLIVENAIDRSTAIEAQQHPWLQTHRPIEVVLEMPTSSRQPSSENIFERLRRIIRQIPSVFWYRIRRSMYRLLRCFLAEEDIIPFVVWCRANPDNENDDLRIYAV